MNWQIIVGAFCLIGGLGNLTEDLGAFLFGVALGVAFIYWGLRKKGIDPLRKKIEKTMVVQEVPRKASNGLPSRYIVLDIETTGFSRTDDRIIEIAANKYNNGQLVEQYHTYVNPGIGIPFPITQLTGITNTDVEDAPALYEIKSEVISFFGSDPLVGHNIKKFDIPFLQEQLNCKFFNMKFDTLTMAKDVFPGLPSYKLSFLDQALHLGGLEHHRAGNDILITNALFHACADPKKYQLFLDDKEALEKIKIEPRRSFYHTIDIHSIHPTDPTARPNTPLTGKNIVFSGYFHTPLDKMMQIAVDAGATLKSHVSKKVNYLVVGEQDTRFADENGMTSKSRTATKLIEEGLADIRIIDEKAFLELTHNMEKPERHPALDDLIKNAGKKTPPAVPYKKKPFSGRVLEPEHKLTKERSTER